MERVRVPVRHGAPRRDQRLAEHLPAEHALPAVLRARAAEQVHLDLLEVQEVDQSLKEGFMPRISSFRRKHGKLGFWSIDRY